jgi:prevent-host-death family protein
VRIGETLRYALRVWSSEIPRRQSAPRNDRRGPPDGGRRPCPAGQNLGKAQLTTRGHREFEPVLACATLTHMERIGVRALQQHASAVLRRVQGGEALEVTERGHPVAFLVPAARRGLLDVLEASGRLTPAEGDLLDLGAPLAVKRGAESPSRRLVRMREHER